MNKEKKTMKKYTVMTVALVMSVMAMFLTGCPATNGLQDVVNDANVTDTAASTKAPVPVVAEPVPTSDTAVNADSNDVDQDEIPDGMGEVGINGGSFRDTKSMEKAVDLNDVVDQQKDRVTLIEIEFSLATSTQPIGKGGGIGNIFVTLPVVDGEWAGKKCLLRAGSYVATIRAYDNCSNSNYDLLFEASSYVTVAAKGRTTMDVLLYLFESHYFTFKVDSLPGSYLIQGSAMITTLAGQTYSVYYRPDWNTGEVVFCVWLPIDFDGADSGAELYVTDATGKPRAMDINFTILDTTDQGPFYIPYVESQDVGEVDMNIGFAEYPDPDEGKG